jgi:hypothetical protein
MSEEYEHSQALRDAQAALIVLRSRTRHLHWVSGGGGYEGMGRRELEQVRTKLDEVDMWLARASNSLRAGGKRAIAEGYPKKEDE